MPLKLKFKQSERVMKRNFLLIVLISLFILGPLYAKTGIAASGGLLYPGLFKSDRYGSQFRIGPGFDLTLRHHLFRFDSTFAIDSRYSIRNYYCDVNLSDQHARFHFSYLSIDLTIPLARVSHWQLYGGGGLSLANLSGERPYTDETVTDTVLMPEILCGVEWMFGENYNLYFESMFQFGNLTVKVDNDIIPVHGVKIALGGTMFLSVD
jgi:hypothetical protein